MTQKTCFCHLMLKQTTPRNMQYDSRHICDFIYARQKVKFRLCKSLTSSYNGNNNNKVQSNIFVSKRDLFPCWTSGYIGIT